MYAQFVLEFVIVVMTSGIQSILFSYERNCLEILNLFTVLKLLEICLKFYSYAKYGNFFCDCGAKEDGSCQALTKRGAQSSDSSQCQTGTSSSNDLIQPTSVRRRLSSPLCPQKAYEVEKHPVLAKQIGMHFFS